MKYILILLLSLSLTKAQALEPSSEKGVSNDTFINYQWALENNGQKLSRDTDDIHPILVESKVGFDIQWKKLQEILKTKVRKETVVAVIDSGISASHDDIKNNVLPGRNFMSDSPRFINDVSDDLGHGTHVAGIIAAEINNSKGISGVADKIKILPLKVYSSGKETEQRSFIERVAKAILFAVDKKVDVINLSLGWPLIIDLPIVKTAIQKALDQNITIVAGAGNDGHALKVLPCSYKEVICVGAIGINGDIPNFSNHGGQVDILAPGEEILSLWPALLLPKNFGLRKYNVVSGTSQATPYVSAAVAVLKSVFPNITSDEIKARLFASSKNDLNWGNKFALNGLVQMASAIEIKPQTVIRPVFKELDQIYINPYDKKFSIDLPIKNYWKASGPVQIQISSLNSNVSFVNRSYSLEKINSQDEISIHVRGYVHDLLKDNSLRFSVSIHHDGKEETYTHESTLSLRTEQIRGLKAYKNISNVKSVLDFEDFNEDAEFYSQSKTDKGIEVSVYRFEGGELIARDPMFIPNATDLYPYFGVVRVDMDFDGVSDYFISAIVKENKEVHIKHFIFNKNLTAKYNQLSEWDFKDEGVLIHQPSVDFVKWNSRELGAVAVPIFWSKGKIPEMDQNPDPFERQSSIDKGLYYLIPLVENGKITLRTRLLNSDANVAQIRKKINARFDEELQFLHFTIKDHSKIQVLMSLGISSNLKYYMAEFDLNRPEIRIQEISLPSMDLNYHSTRKISEDKIAFFGIYKNDLARLAILNTKTFEIQDYELSSNSLANGIVSLLAVRENENEVSIFVEGVESFLLYKIDKSNHRTEKYIAPINRFSYLPGQFFTDILYPIDVGGQMSIYVDSSNINSKNIHISTVGANSINTPIKWSLELPANCTALTPRKLFGRDSNISYIFLCKEGSQYTLKTFQL